MKRFANTRAEEVHKTGFARGVPKNIGRQAHWLMHLLLAAQDLQDVGFIGKITRWCVDDRELYGLHINGKWYVTFLWLELARAVEVNIERR